MSYLAAKRYARTLFELADEHQKIEIVSENLSTIETLINQSPDFVQFVRYFDHQHSFDLPYAPLLKKV